MRLIHANGRFEAISSYEEKDIAKSAGFLWDKANKVWYTSDAKTALKLKEYADTACLLTLVEVAEKAHKDLAASHAATSDLAVPAPDGLDYLPYQKAGVGFALGRKATLIADEMGLGKTMQAIGIINSTENLANALIIVPAGLRLNWERELKKWLVKDLPINRGKESISQRGILILGYEEASKVVEELEKVEWDLIVCDEAHYLKNPKAKRTKTILGGKDHDGLKPSQWLFLTGTPILNRPVELWTIVQKIDPDGLGKNWYHFTNRYCDAKNNGFGMDVSGASNLGELNEKLRMGGMIRRTKDQVLKDLPAKRHSLIPFEPDTKARKIIAEQNRKALARAKNLKKAAALERKNKEVFSAEIEKLRTGAQVDFNDIARMRHELALLKVPQVSEYVINAVSSHPVIVFAHHRDVIAEIEKALKKEGIKVGVIIGGMGDVKKDRSVVAFQDGSIDCLLVGITAAAVGLTLTRGSHVIFAEADWTPGIMQQAEDRAHRIGQKNAVQVDWLVLDGSLDAKMIKTLVAKQGVTSAAMGDNTPEEDIPTATVPPALIITADDFARAKVNEARAALEEQEKKAALDEENRIKDTVKPGRYAVEIDGEIKTVNLKFSGAGNFYVKHGDGDISFHEGDKVATILAALTPEEREQAKEQYFIITQTCRKCGQLLGDPVSIALGLGPECGRAEHAAYHASQVEKEAA